MKVSFPSIHFQITDAFTKKINIVLNEQQKKILGIVTLIFSGFILLVAIKRCLKNKDITPVQVPTIHESPKVKPIQPNGIPLSPVVNLLSPKPKLIPPFVKSIPFSERPSVPAGYEWVQNRSGAKAFMTTTHDLSIISAMAMSTDIYYFKYPELYLNIRDLIEFASLDQVEAITKALAQIEDTALLKDIFYFLIDDLSKKEKMETVVKSLSTDQFMSLLYVPDTYDDYQRQKSCIGTLPGRVLENKDRFNFPNQFIDGCQKLAQYSKDIEPEVRREFNINGGLCD